jgi:hypothetical protein
MEAYLHIPSSLCPADNMTHVTSKHDMNNRCTQTNRGRGGGGGGGAARVKSPKLHRAIPVPTG